MRNSMAGMRPPQERLRQGARMICLSGSCQAPVFQNAQGWPPRAPAEAPIERQQGRCECIPQETCIDRVMLATAYVPYQLFCGAWPPRRSLLAGTVFAELYSPYRKREFANLEPEITCGMRPAEGGVY